MKTIMTSGLAFIIALGATARSIAFAADMAVTRRGGARV
jgi:hypothetical protein